MQSINFSHPYTKLINTNGKVCQYATLLDVVKVELSELSAEFLNYDTDFGVYKLPQKGKFVLLIFQKPGLEGLFTTIRHPEKVGFYKENIGEIFKIEIPE